MEATLNFNQIYSENYNRIYCFINRRLFKPEISQELTNDTFVKASKHLNDFNCDLSSLSTWLHNIAKNILIDYFRSVENNRKSKTVHVSDYVNDNGSEMFEVEDNNVDNSEEIERFNKIQCAISKLKPIEKNVIELILDGWKLKEVAELLEIPVNTVKVTAMRSKLQMRKELVNKP